MLIARPQMYGLQIVEESRGHIARGSVYVLLDRMETKGLVESEQEEKDPGVSGIPRRMYKATGAGARAHRAWTNRRDQIVQSLTPAIS